MCTRFHIFQGNTREMGGIIIYNLTRQDAMMNASAVGTAAVVKGFLIKSLVGLFFMDQNVRFGVAG